MVFADSLTKAERLLELRRIFWHNPQRVFTSSELARRLGVSERTIRKYLVELGSSGLLPILRDGHGVRLVEGARMDVLPVTFSLEETVAVYLAGRLLDRVADEPNPDVHGALRRLAQVMPEQIQPVFEHLSVRRSAAVTTFSRVFREIARGWILQREVRLDYHPLSSDPSTYLFRPYLMEPAAASASVYAIGEVEGKEGLRVLKLERVRRASLLASTFEAPAGDELLDRLDRSWGIWIHQDEAPVMVRLLFDPAGDRAVERRIRETRWHPSQQLKERDDGTLLLTLSVTTWVEMLPWILGWGAYCEVLEPEDLRSAVASEHRRAAEAYRTGG